MKSKEDPNVIVGEETATASSSSVVELPSSMSIKKNIQRIRRARNPQLLTPSSLNEMIIPEPFTKTLRDEQFLLYDSNSRTNRFLVFSTMENLRRLSTCRIWLGDGTFSSVPSVFQQLYTIHGGLVRDSEGNEEMSFKSVPLVYVLTPSKRTSVYRKILKCLIEKTDGYLEPEVFVSDYESALIKAVQEVFPDVSMQGCHFHFSQCIVRAIGDVHQKSRYNTNEEYAHHVKMLIALAYVPPAHVVRAYNALIACDYYRDNAEYFTDLLEYFKSTWIGIERRNGTVSAKFPIELWNCYYAVVNDDPRTNNNMEGWHNNFHQRVGRSHEQLGKFIHALQIEQSCTENVWEQFSAGRVVATRKRRRYMGYDARLRALVGDWNVDGDIVEYLRGIAYNVKP